MKRTLMRTMLVVGIVTMMCGFSMQAGAISFDYSQSSGFAVDSSLISNDPNSTNNDIKWYQLNSEPLPPVDYFNTIFWGNGNDNGGLRTDNPWGNILYSGLRVLGYDGVISDDGVPVPISTIYHQNMAIDSMFYVLASADIYSELTIKNYTDLNTVPITFRETLNTTWNADLCEKNFGGPCPDEFTFFAPSFAPIFFLADGQNYRVDFTLGDPVNADGPYWNGNYGTVWTAENELSSMTIFMEMVPVVPEPATLTLLGLGLLGIGLAARRRKS